MKSLRSTASLLALGAVLAAAAACYLMADRPWLRAPQGGVTSGVAAAGPLIRNLPVVVLFGSVLLLVFGPLARRVTGALAAGAAAWMAWLAFAVQPRSLDDLPSSRGSAAATRLTGWSTGYGAVAIAMVAFGLVLLAVPPGRAPVAPPPAEDPDAWRIIERGMDPTGE